LKPGIASAGGLLELTEIADMADAYSVKVSPLLEQHYNGVHRNASCLCGDAQCAASQVLPMVSPSVRGWLFVITKSLVVRLSCLDHRGMVWK
jgi:L-alanine-DL-glutamate epimerase-like enolase superfamily enzyme